MTNLEQITNHLKAKGNLKQEIYQTTLAVFENWKEIIKAYSEQMQASCKDDLFDIEYKENGKFEVEFKFAGDVLLFNMHTNVFSFDDEYYVNKTPYVQEDPSRKYCGMIEVYNFLADSFKYDRFNDVGYLIARIFINHEGHFFIEGEEQLGFLYKEFDKLVVTPDLLALILEQAMIFAIDFDLWAPNYTEVRELTVGQKLQQNGTITHKTAKRLGFEFSNQQGK